jgi:tripartite-type tricarboxylate transporter receptor subunit TctC
VPYRGNGPALADLMGGHIAMMFTSSDSLTQPHKAGRIRVLATSGRARSPFLPEVPTFREAGYDIEGTGWFGLFAPAATPAEIVEHVNEIVVAALRTPELQARIRALGLQPTGTAPATLAAIQQADSELWAPAVRASGFSPDR